MIERKLRNVVISGYGYKIKSRKGLILIKGEKEKIYLSPREIEQIIVAGEVSITSNVIRLLLTNGVDLVFIQHNPKFFARVMRNDANFITNLWRKQIVMSEERKLEISKEIVDCLIYNKIRMLQHLEKNRNIDFGAEIEHLRSKREHLKECDSRISLMGIEGEATKTYFSAIRKIIPKELGFVKRVKHPPRDPVNSMLSYGYTILISRVSYGLMLAGLNVFEGIFHESYRDRMALAYDLAEEFRQPIIDRVVITEIVRGKVSKEDFDIRPEMCYMKGDFKKRYLEAIYSRFEDRYNYYGKNLQFLDIIFEEAKKLASAIEKGEKYKGFKYR